MHECRLRRWRRHSIVWHAKDDVENRRWHAAARFQSLDPETKRNCGFWTLLHVYAYQVYVRARQGTGGPAPYEWANLLLVVVDHCEGNVPFSIRGGQSEGEGGGGEDDEEERR
jgi:hypothetical protein